jgi:hypothetical protein
MKNEALGEARFVERIWCDAESTYTGYAAVYDLTPPLRVSDEFVLLSVAGKTFSRVIASAAMNFDGSVETMLFPYPEYLEGEHAHLPGSVRDTLKHADAFRVAGYRIVDAPDEVVEIGPPHSEREEARDFFEATDFLMEFAGAMMGTKAIPSIKEYE